MYLALAGLGGIPELEGRLQMLRNQLMLAKNTVSTVKNTPVTWSYKTGGYEKHGGGEDRTTTKTYAQISKATPRDMWGGVRYRIPAAVAGGYLFVPGNIYQQAKSAIKNAQSGVTELQKQVAEVEDQLVAAKKKAEEAKAEAAAKERAAELTLPPMPETTSPTTPKELPTPSSTPTPISREDGLTAQQRVIRLKQAQAQRLMAAKQSAPQQQQQQRSSAPTKQAPMSTGKKVAIGAGVAALAVGAMVFMD